MSLLRRIDQQSNNTNNQRTPLPQRPGRFNPFGSQQQTNWTFSPVRKTVARFHLDGLGDPFYKLLGHAINTDLNNGRAVAAALENGGEPVEQIQVILDQVWDSHKLTGAMLVYRWEQEAWKTLETATPMPLKMEDDIFSEDSDDDKDKKEEQKAPPPPDYVCLRALDLQLVLNILGRSRSQLLLATAPLVFSREYLNRSLVIDDPRVVALVRATGYLQEKV